MAGAEKFVTAYEQHYVGAQYAWVQFVAEYLADCSKVFEGDLQSMLILAIIGQSYLARIIDGGYRGSAPLAPPVLFGAAINASSIAEVTGIPRQTVRRKIDDLERKGWIEKNSSGGWQIAVRDQKNPVKQDLSALEARSIARLGRLVIFFHNIMIENLAADELRD
jgi:DNA-binding MarR family transcriptional regulator